MKTHAMRTLCLFAVAALAACGGPTSKKGMSKLAAGAPPPPPAGSGDLDREVTREAQKDFAQAVAFYRQQAKGGWNKAGCSAAADRFESVARSHNKMVEARFNAGLSYQHCGMMREAEAQYQAALKINPGHAPSLANVGEIYFKGGNESVAKQYWERAVQADQQVVAARNNLAWLIIREMREKKPTGGNFDRMHNEAAGQLSRALAVENDSIAAYVLYALLYMEGSERNSARLALARLLLDKAEEISARYPPLHNARGLLLLRQNNVAQALASFQTAVQLNPRFIEARMNVGNIVLDFRKYDEAEAQFAAVLKLAPKEFDAVLGLGIAQRGLRKLDEAEATYTQAAKLAPGRAEPHFNLGVLYQDFRANATEDLRAAQEAYRTAVRHFRQALSKSNATPAMKKEAQENIAVCEKNVRDLEEAIKFRRQSQSKAK